ncbi:hypothetical protein ONJ17_25745, partial [Salmonella enterica subsp. enterica serovar Agona]|nr:hypothetical protein [Salmonella enterica subsp. enterica serovar Agona]
EVAEGLKTEADLHAFSRMLTKLTVETVLNAELADHPGYEKNAAARHTKGDASQRKGGIGMNVVFLHRSQLVKRARQAVPKEKLE